MSNEWASRKQPHESTLFTVWNVRVKVKGKMIPQRSLSRQHLKSPYSSSVQSYWTKSSRGKDSGCLKLSEPKSNRYLNTWREKLGKISEFQNVFETVLPVMMRHHRLLHWKHAGCKLNQDTSHCFKGINITFCFGNQKSPTLLKESRDVGLCAYKIRKTIIMLWTKWPYLPKWSSQRKHNIRPHKKLKQNKCFEDSDVNKEKHM